LKKKITYNSDSLKRSVKSNPFPNETYYSRLKDVDGQMNDYEIEEDGHYWKIKSKDKKNCG